MVHDFGDFARVHQSQRSSGYREVLGVNAHRLSVNGPGADDHTVSVENLLIHIKIFCLMLYEHVVLMERVFVQDGFNALTGRQFAHGYLLLNRLFATTLKHDFLSLS